MNLFNVTRLEIIDHRTGGQGRILVCKHPEKMTFSLQDSGLTLKIFLDDLKKEK